MGSMESWCNQICFPSRTMNVPGAGLPRSVRQITIAPATSGTPDSALRHTTSMQLLLCSLAQMSRGQATVLAVFPGNPNSVYCFPAPACPTVGLSDSPPPGAGGHSAKHPRQSLGQIR